MAKNWRNGKLYKAWRKVFLLLTPYCNICGETSQLHVHHINDASTHPLQKYSPTNGIVLCQGCHFKFHIYYMQGYQNKCTRKDLEYFIKLIKPKG